MAYNTRRKQGPRKKTRKSKSRKSKPAHGNHHLQQRPIIEQGVGLKENYNARLNACMMNAHRNVLAMLTQKGLRKVKDGNPAFVDIEVGSMGFRSDDGLKTHWEFGGPRWTKAEQFRKGSTHWDAHAWVVYTDTQGREVIIDPYFRDYRDYCRIWGIKTTDVRASRVYQRLRSEWTRGRPEGGEGIILFAGMCASTALTAPAITTLMKKIRKRREYFSSGGVSE